LKKNLFYNLLYTASQLLFPLVTIPYVSRVLDPESVGRIGFIDSLTYFSIAIAEFGIMVYGTREIARLRNDIPALRNLVSELMLLHIVTSFFSFLFYFLAIYASYDRIGDPRLILFSFCMLLFNAIACEWYFLGTEQFRFIALRLIITRFAALSAVFIFVKERDDYYLYYLIMVLAVITNIAWNFGVLTKQVKLVKVEYGWTKHIRYIWVTFLISILYGIPVFLDNVILGFTVSAYAVGIYSLALKVVRILGMAVTESLMVFFPRIVNYISLNNFEEVKVLYNKTLRMIIIFCIPLSIGLIMIADDAVKIIFGPQFAEVAVDLKILSVFPLLKSYSLFLRNEILLPFHHEKYYVKTLAWGAIAFVLFALLLCPLYGHAGACYAIIASEIVVIFINQVFINKMGNVFLIIEWKILLQTLFVSFLFIPLVWIIRLFSENEWIITGLSIISCTLMYAFVQIVIFKNPLVLEIRNAINRSL
jgi:O-antigen/teichoic acid export membrane protein